MRERRRFTIEFVPEIEKHLLAIEPKYYSLIHRTMQSQLAHEPNVQTRNRKPLDRPMALAAGWELRFGPSNRFRVFYDVDVARSTVRVVGIGVKQRNRLFIGGEEAIE